MEKKGRLTIKKLIEWCNKKFKELEIDNYEVVEITRTRFTSDQYEGGACKLIIAFRSKELSVDHILSRSYFYSFYSIRELQDYISKGYEMYLKLNSQRASLRMLTDLEIEVRKINPPLLAFRE